MNPFTILRRMASKAVADGIADAVSGAMGSADADAPANLAQMYQRLALPAAAAAADPGDLADDAPAPAPMPAAARKKGK